MTEISRKWVAQCSRIALTLFAVMAASAASIPGHSRVATAAVGRVAKDAVGRLS